MSGFAYCVHAQAPLWPDGGLTFTFPATSTMSSTGGNSSKCARLWCCDINSITASRTFTYDDLNRLISASGTFGVNQSQTSCTYAYNAIGNITNKRGAVFSYSDSMNPCAGRGSQLPLIFKALVDELRNGGLQISQSARLVLFFIWRVKGFQKPAPHRCLSAWQQVEFRRAVGFSQDSAAFFVFMHREQYLLQPLGQHR